MKVNAKTLGTKRGRPLDMESEEDADDKKPAKKNKAGVYKVNKLNPMHY